MKKVLLFAMAAFVVVSLNAQQYAAKKMSNLKFKSPVAKIDQGLNIPYLPLNKPTQAHNKSVTAVQIGTSGNVYTALYDPNYQLEYNPELNILTHVHRAGGPWGGASGDLRCIISYDKGLTWTDSVVFPVQNGNHYYRYPNVIVHNPAGNTNPSDAYLFVNGPITDGAGWNFMFFDSKQINGSNEVINHPTPLFADQLERINLSGGNGTFWTGSLHVNSSDTWYDTAYLRIMTFNPNTNGFDINNVQNFTRNWKMRQFSNATIEWWFNWNNYLDTDGQSGYMWCFGAEQEFDPYNETSTPLVWSTLDGGQNWIKANASGCWHTLSNITDYIWPVRQSLIEHPNNPELWEYRIFFQGGSSVDENYSPGVIDYQGRLHFLAVIEGMYSNHPDSLGYSYANHPKYLFDVYTTGWDPVNYTYTWDVQFVDTILTGVVPDDASPFCDSDGCIGWEHYLNISASPDKKVIFAVWTDTDPQFDTINTMPDIKCRAFNYETMKATPIINFTAGEGGMYFYVNTPHFVIDDGNDYIIPLSYIDVYDNGQPIMPQKHWYVQDLRISKNDFTEDIAPSTITGQCITSANINKYNTDMKVAQNMPNPAKENTQIAITLPDASNVNITVTNLMGQTVMSINKNLSAGKNVVNLNVSNLTSGVYFYTVTANNSSVTKKMIVE